MMLPRSVSAMEISIHAPCTGSDRRLHPPQRFRLLFQSTLPARGATASWSNRYAPQTLFQSTLPARGATSTR